MISHQQGILLLQYVDHTMFLLKGTSEAAENVSAMLYIFPNFTSLCLNRDKSKLVTFEMPKEEAVRCSAILATPRESLPTKYLGIPLSAGQVSIQDWQPVIEKVERRLEGWKACMLSWGDCLVLIKAVLSIIPTFFMSILRARVPFKIGLLRVPFKCADSSGEEPDKGMPEK